MRKRYAVLLVGLLVSALVISVVGCSGTKNTVKIGLITPLTGNVKTFGESVRDGFMLALSEVGTTSGSKTTYKVGDWNIEYVVGDDRNDPTEAVNVATKLATQDKVQVIIGSVTSSSTIPISAVAESKKVVQITPTGTAEKVTVEDGKRKTYVFRACFIDPFQGTVGARFALNTLKAQTAAIMIDQGNDYVIGLAANFKAAFEAGGGQVLLEEHYAKGDTNFSAALTKIAAAKPDLLYLPDYYQVVNLIGQQAREKGITAPFLGGDGWDSSELDFATFEGGYFTNHYSPEDQRPEVQAFITKFQAKYNRTPDALATLAYDATKLTLEAIKRANSNDPAKIRDAMQGIKDFTTVSGKISFDQNGNPVKSAVILQIKDGQQVYVETVNP